MKVNYQCAFIQNSNPECPLLQCLVCGKTVDFKNLLKTQNKQYSFVNTLTVNKKAPKASYLVAELTAQNTRL